MSFEEMVVALVGAIGAFILVGYLAAKTFGLIKTWINRNNNSISEEEFDRLAKAFMQYKKDSERRLRNLEAIISEEDLESSSDTQSGPKQIDAPRRNIEIKEQESGNENSQKGNSNNLRNMLRE